MPIPYFVANFEKGKLRSKDDSSRNAMTRPNVYIGKVLPNGDTINNTNCNRLWLEEYRVRQRMARPRLLYSMDRTDQEANAGTTISLESLHIMDKLTPTLKRIWEILKK